MKFPILSPKYSLLAAIISGVLAVVVIVWLRLLLPGWMYSGSVLLLTSLIGYLLFAGPWSPSQIRFVILVFAVGTGILVIGERNPAMFGSFSMGDGLGPFFGSVGMLCGLLVALPTLFAYQVVGGLTENIYLRSLIGAVLVTVPAILISYNGEMLSFFSWFEIFPAFSGFIIWFAISFFLQFAGQQLQVKMENPMALPLYIIWIGAQVVITILRFAS